MRDQKKTTPYIAYPPCCVTFLASSHNLVGLAINAYGTEYVSTSLGIREREKEHTQIHDMVSTDGTVVDNDV